MSAIAKIIKIVKIPHGDAPLSVRCTWLGCTLPCAGLECGHTFEYVEPVLSEKRIGLMTAKQFLERPRGDEKIAGYSVYQDIALRVLECHSPAAADWFYSRGFPNQKLPFFRFKLEEVEIIKSYDERDLLKLGPIHRHDDMETGTMRFMGLG